MTLDQASHDLTKVLGVHARHLQGSFISSPKLHCKLLQLLRIRYWFLNLQIGVTASEWHIRFAILLGFLDQLRGILANLFSLVFCELSGEVIDHWPARHTTHCTISKRSRYTPKLTSTTSTYVASHHQNHHQHHHYYKYSNMLTAVTIYCYYYYYYYYY